MCLRFQLFLFPATTPNICLLSDSVAFFSPCSTQKDLYLIFDPSTRSLLNKWCEEAGLSSDDSTRLQQQVDSHAKFLNPTLLSVCGADGRLPLKCPSNMRPLIRLCSPKSPAYPLLCGPTRVLPTLISLSKGKCYVAVIFAKTGYCLTLLCCVATVAIQAIHSTSQPKRY